MNFFIKFAFQLEIFIALVGHDFMQKPHEVQLLFILGLNIARKSIASSKQGSLQEKHIVLFHDKQDITSISILTLILFLSSSFKTSFGQTFAHSSQ